MPDRLGRHGCRRFLQVAAPVAFVTAVLPAREARGAVARPTTAKHEFDRLLAARNCRPRRGRPAPQPSAQQSPIRRPVSVLLNSTSWPAILLTVVIVPWTADAEKVTSPVVESGSGLVHCSAKRNTLAS